MQIFVVPGTCDYTNMGDLAMLQIAMSRLRMLWPAASFKILTYAPNELTRHCPGAIAIPWDGLKGWLGFKALPGGLFPNLKGRLYQQFPPAPDRFSRMVRFVRPRHYEPARQLAKALFEADLLLVTGCGLLTDAFRSDALMILELLEAAAGYGLPCALLSQGVGPIKNYGLFRRAAQVLPQARAIFIREQRAGLPLLEKLSVPRNRIFLTGDDAVEIGFRKNQDMSHDRLGVNLRLAEYSGLDGTFAGMLRGAIVAKAQQYRADLAGIPILYRGRCSDLQTLCSVLPGERHREEDFDTPEKVIRRISGCRVVIAGSYHAGVFALSQGIPIVGVVQSDYYRDKFEGLADQFGKGCIVVRADSQKFMGDLSAALDELWLQSDELRPGLLSAAEKQIKAAQAAYAKLPELLQIRNMLPILS